MSSTEKENKSFDEILVMQCYGAEDTFTVKECKKAVKLWLEQKLEDEKEKAFPETIVLRELIEELSL
jgi:hypothetical protein